MIPIIEPYAMLELTLLVNVPAIVIGLLVLRWIIR